MFRTRELAGDLVEMDAYDIINDRFMLRWHLASNLSRFCADHWTPEEITGWANPLTRLDEARRSAHIALVAALYL